MQWESEVHVLNMYLHYGRKSFCLWWQTIWCILNLTMQVKFVWTAHKKCCWSLSDHFLVSCSCVYMITFYSVYSSHSDMSSEFLYLWLVFHRVLSVFKYIYHQNFPYIYCRMGIQISCFMTECFVMFHAGNRKMSSDYFIDISHCVNTSSFCNLLDSVLICRFHIIGNLFCTLSYM